MAALANGRLAGRLSMPKHEDGGQAVSSDLAVASVIGGSRPVGTMSTSVPYAGEARSFGHLVRIKHVIHVESFLLLGNN